MTDTTTAPAQPERPSSRDDRRFLGHPAGLGWMFQVELWERFSYYGMRAILLYFLVDTFANGGLGLDKSTGQAVLAAYGAAVYLLSIPGGIVADRFIGPWKSVLWGGLVIMAGHVCLSIPVPALSWLGICLVAFGTGFIKPNLSTMIGVLYDADDPRRDGGFQIFYMAVNIGSLFSPIVVAWLRNIGGYHLGFGAAAVGMALALVAFLVGRRQLHGLGDRPPSPLEPGEGRKMAIMTVVVLAGAAAIWAVLFMVFKDFADATINTVAVVSILAAISYFVTMFRSPKVTSNERQHLWAYLPMWIGAMMFFMIFEQAAGKMATFADTNTQLDIGGFHIDPEWFQSVNPLAIIILAPLVGIFFTRRAGRFPKTPMKFVMGVIIITISAFMMGFGFQVWPGGAGHLSPWWFLSLVFVVQTFGELSLSPVGLSATTMLAPKAFAGQAMALWLLASASGQGISAIIIQLMKDLPDSTYFYVLGTMAAVISAVLLALTPWTNKKMEDIETMRAEGAAQLRAKR